MQTTPLSEALLRTLSSLYENLSQRIDQSQLLANTERLWRSEFGQTSECHHASAALAESLLVKTGCQNVEKIALPADGRTTFQDKRLPLGWRATMGRLEVVGSSIPFESPVIADFARHPFHLIKGSVSTPSEGIEAPLVREDAPDEKLCGAMVLLDPNKRPSYRDFQGKGILGIVSDYLVGRDLTPDAIQWANGCSDSCSWHIGADDRPTIGFSISPATGDRLRAALSEGEVRVKVYSDGQRYIDTLDVVTGVIPGSDPREIWLLAHLYEPLANDNSSGVACALEIARVLQALQAEGTLPPPRFTLRLVFAMEVYGFAAYAEKRGGYLRDQVMAALNIDALPILPCDRSIVIGLSQSGSPSSVDYLMETLIKAGIGGHHTVAGVQTEGLYADDRQFGDSSIGVPTLWLTRVDRKLLPEKTLSLENRKLLYLWHNSEQDMSCIEPELFHDVTALYATFVAMLMSEPPPVGRLQLSYEISLARLNAERERIAAVPSAALFRPGDWVRHRLEIESARLRDYERFGVPSSEIETLIVQLKKAAAKISAEIEEAPTLLPHGDLLPSALWAEAQKLTVHRIHRGLPRDMAAAPVGQRGVLLDLATTLVLVHADGSRTVADLLRYAQWEQGRLLAEPEVAQSLKILRYLDTHGYIALNPP